MDPMTIMALASVAGSVLQSLAAGQQANEQQQQLQQYQQQLISSAKETYSGQSAQLYQQLLQQQAQMQQQLKQRREEGLMNLSMITASAATGNISGNSLIRQLAVARGSEAEAIGQGKTNWKQTQANYLARAQQLRRDLTSTLNKINSQQAPDPFLSALTTFGQSGGFQGTGQVLGSIV
jgi:hypothetical protein